jgi:hypothetical protein
VCVCVCGWVCVWLGCGAAHAAHGEQAGAGRRPRSQRRAMLTAPNAAARHHARPRAAHHEVARVKARVRAAVAAGVRDGAVGRVVAAGRELLGALGPRVHEVAEAAARHARAADRTRLVAGQRVAHGGVVGAGPHHATLELVGHDLRVATGVVAAHGRMLCSDGCHREVCVCVGGGGGRVDVSTHAQHGPTPPPREHGSSHAQHGTTAPDQRTHPSNTHPPTQPTHTHTCSCAPWTGPPSGQKGKAPAGPGCLAA